MPGVFILNKRDTKTFDVGHPTRVSYICFKAIQKSGVTSRYNRSENISLTLEF